MSGPTRWLVVFLLLLPGLAYGQNDPPSVAIDVIVKADLYLEELGASISDIEQALEQAAIEQLSSFNTLRFVTWSRANADMAHALHLEIEEVASGLGSEIRLRIISQIDGQRNDLTDESLEHFNPTIFDGFDQKYAQDPTRLSRELINWLKRHINDAFVDALKPNFLNHIPLASRVHLDADVPQLIVPLRFAALNPQKESKFRVDFVSTKLGDPRDGTINLSMTGKRRIPQSTEDGLDCEIAVFKYPTLTTMSVESARSRWDEIKEIMDEGHLVNVKLFMEEYIPSFFENTSDGLVLDGPPSL